MLDVRLFRERAFSAASGSVTVAFFALFGFIFLITQYMQFVRGYGTLSTGARILPVALEHRRRLGDRGRLAGAASGTRAVVVHRDWSSSAAAFLWISQVGHGDALRA